MSGILQDLRYALRMLHKNPGFTAVAVITLALGIGATTAIFSAVHAVLLAPLPYRDVDRLAMIWGSNPSRGDLQFPISAGDFSDWKQKNDVFEDIAASYDDEVTLTGRGEPKLVLGYAVSANYFQVLGVHPRLGRTFTEEEARSKANVAVLSDQLWRTKLQADPGVLGKAITLDDKAVTVIGVMPPDFDYPPKTELWKPLAISAAATADYEHRYIRVLGRLKKGVSVREAQTRMDALEHQIAAQHPQTDAGNATWITSLRTQLAGDIRTPLLALFGAVGFVLFIACVNIASLLLARSAGRRNEISVRIAIGARRARLLRQFLSECLLLSLLGGLLGVALAFACTRFLVAIFPNNIANLSIPKVDAIPIDAPVLWFALGATLVTGLVFAAIPALQSADLTANDALRETGRTMVSSAKSARVRRTLVTAEVALSLVLITGAGLMFESFRRVTRQNLGFQPEHLVALEVFLPRNQYPPDHPQKVSAFLTDVANRIGELPGVQSVGVTNYLPLTGFWGETDFLIQGQAHRPDAPKRHADDRLASPGYFSTLGASLLRGRDFADSDRLDSEKVAIVNAVLARQYFGDVDPLGKALEIADPAHPEHVEDWRIVGVVSEIQSFGPEEKPHAEIYRPLSQVWFPLLAFVARTQGDPGTLLKPAEQALWSVAKDQPIFDAMPMSTLAAQSVTLRRVSTILVGAFALLALVLSAVGLYGVMAYSVVQRTHEIGLRMALGADRRDVLRLMVRQGTWIVLIGEVIGFAASLVLAHTASGLLYGVSPGDPWAIAGGMILLMLVAVLASCLPAARAMRVDPVEALRYQ